MILGNRFIKKTLLIISAIGLAALSYALLGYALLEIAVSFNQLPFLLANPLGQLIFAPLVNLWLQIVGIYLISTGPLALVLTATFISLALVALTGASLFLKSAISDGQVIAEFNNLFPKTLITDLSAISSNNQGKKKKLSNNSYISLNGWIVIRNSDNKSATADNSHNYPLTLVASGIYALNPICWLRVGLSAVKRLAMLIIDIPGGFSNQKLHKNGTVLDHSSTLPSRVLKGAIAVIFDVVDLPLVLIQSIFDIPFHLSIIASDLIQVIGDRVAKQEWFKSKNNSQSAANQKPIHQWSPFQDNKISEVKFTINNRVDLKKRPEPKEGRAQLRKELLVTYDGDKPKPDNSKNSIVVGEQEILDSMGKGTGIKTGDGIDIKQRTFIPYTMSLDSKGRYGHGKPVVKTYPSVLDTVKPQTVKSSEIGSSDRQTLTEMLMTTPLIHESLYGINNMTCRMGLRGDPVTPEELISKRGAGMNSRYATDPDFQKNLERQQDKLKRELEEGVKKAQTAYEDLANREIRYIQEKAFQMAYNARSSGEFVQDNLNKNQSTYTAKAKEQYQSDLNMLKNTLDQAKQELNKHKAKYEIYSTDDSYADNQGRTHTYRTKEYYTGGRPHMDIYENTSHQTGAITSYSRSFNRAKTFATGGEPADDGYYYVYMFRIIGGYSLHQVGASQYSFENEVACYEGNSIEEMIGFTRWKGKQSDQKEIYLSQYWAENMHDDELRAVFASLAGRMVKKEDLQGNPSLHFEGGKWQNHKPSNCKDSVFASRVLAYSDVFTSFIDAGPNAERERFVKNFYTENAKAAQQRKVK